MADVSDGAGEARRSTAIPRPPEAGGLAHERSGQGRGTDPSRSLTIERPEREQREHRTAPSEARDRWLLAGAAFLVQLALGAVYAWSVFVKPLRMGECRDPDEDRRVCDVSKPPKWALAGAWRWTSSAWGSSALVIERIRADQERTKAF